MTVTPEGRWQMTANEPKVAVRRRGDVAVLDIVGDIDRTADTPLQQAYDQAVTDGGQAVLLNFGEVGYINSTGIAVIVSLLARARKERRVISAYGLTEHYRQIFELTRLDEAIGIHDSEDAAVAAVDAR